MTGSMPTTPQERNLSKGAVVKAPNLLVRSSRSLGNLMKRKCRAILIVAILVGLNPYSGLVGTSPIQAAEKTVARTPNLTPMCDDVVARVNGYEIRRARIDEFVERRLNGRPISDDAQARLFEAALEHLIDRQLIAEQLKQTPHWPGPNELRLARQELEDRLEATGQSLEQYLASRKMTVGEWENEVGWRIAWSSFLDETLTEPTLREFFDQHRRQFDGTRIRVAHILWEASGEFDPEQAVGHARDVRDRIQRGELSWDDAVRAESDAKSSAENGGDIGWIEFDGPMPPVFSRAAFELDPGQISQPIVSTFGVHLIRCIEIEPGKNDFGDVRDEVRQAAIAVVYRDMASQGQGRFTVERGSR